YCLPGSISARSLAALAICSRRFVAVAKRTCCAVSSFRGGVRKLVMDRLLPANGAGILTSFASTGRFLCQRIRFSLSAAFLRAALSVYLDVSDTSVGSPIRPDSYRRQPLRQTGQ